MVSSSSSSSSTLVNVSEDADLRLVTLLCDGMDNTVLQQCTSYLSEGNFYKVLSTILIGSSNTNGNSTTIQMMLQRQSNTEQPITEVIATFSLLSSMIQRLESSDQVQEILQLLLSTICDGGAKTSIVVVERQMAILSSIYNMMDKPYKCMLLERMIRLTATSTSTNESPDGSSSVSPNLFLQSETTLGRLISSPMVSANTTSTASSSLSVPQLPPVINLLTSWNATDSERRSLYTTICNILPSSDIRQQRFLLLLIDSYNNHFTTTTATKDLINDAALIKTVKQVSIGTIRDPVTLFRDQRNLLSQKIVQQVLQQHDAPLLALLTVFQEGTMSEYETFLATHGGSTGGASNDAKITTLFASWGLDPKLCVRYMRILSLCTLAIGQEVISYDEIIKALHLNTSTTDTDTDDDVESWIIAAVNSGLLQAKMDQLQEIVLIERCVVRKFDIDQWKHIQGQLLSWKEHVGTILGTFQRQTPE